MTLRDLIPYRKNKANALARVETQMQPFAALQRRINRMFDDFLGDFGLSPLRMGDWIEKDFVPTLDVSENDKEVIVTAELAGLDEKDIQIRLNGDMLTISGEKKSEHEEKDAQHYMMERSYGQFSRTIQLPAEVDDSKAEAVFKKGVLKIKLPKTPAEQSKTKRIEVKKE